MEMPAAVVLASSVEEAIRSHAARNYPHECCGLLLGVRERDAVHIHEVRAARNIAEEGRLHERYVVDPRDILAADREGRAAGLEVVGVYHSHPDHPAVPSRRDSELAWEGFAYLILSIHAGGEAGLRAWQLPAGGSPMQEVAIRVA
jgi:proteasome lid subunit RPN8/RPN11